MLTNFPNGITSFGIPMIGGNVPGVPTGAGVVAFVGSAGMLQNFSGVNAYATIQAALDASPEGSIIFVAPGTFAENVTVSRDYISLIQMNGAGYGRPDVVPATGVALAVQGQGFTSIGLRYSSNDNDCVQQHGNGFQYFDNVFDGTSGQSATQGEMRLVGAVDDSHTASEGIIRGNLFRGSTSGAGIIMQWALAAAGGTGITDDRILGNVFVGNGVDLLSAVNTNGGGAGIFQRMLVAGNWFLTVGAGYVYADLNQGGAPDKAVNGGLFSGNFFADAAIISSQFAINGQPNAIFTGNYDAAGLINGAAFNS